MENIEHNRNLRDVKTFINDLFLEKLDKSKFKNFFITYKPLLVKDKKTYLCRSRKSDVNAFVYSYESLDETVLRTVVEELVSEFEKEYENNEICFYEIEVISSFNNLEKSQLSFIYRIATHSEPKIS